MNSSYKSKKGILLIIDILAISLSFVVAIVMRFFILSNWIGSSLNIKLYGKFFIFALIIYLIVSFVKGKPRIEHQSYKEIVLMTIEEQAIFITAYVMFFFIFPEVFVLSRIFVGLFFLCNVIFGSFNRMLYHRNCLKKKSAVKKKQKESEKSTSKGAKKTGIQHVYIIGSKSIGMYGGYESFVMNLLEQHKDRKDIKYHISCKANGQGYLNFDKLPEAKKVNDEEFTYCNAHGFLIKVPDKIGAAQAIYYDLKALSWVCNHIEKNHIPHPIVYILASRIGPFEKKYVQRIHDESGLIFQNPDGHEDWRRKWSFFVRKYWKLSERYAVKYADLVVCDSKSIERYIQEEYASYNPKTTYIAYGAHIVNSGMTDDDEQYLDWISQHNLSNDYYISVGRFVEENNFEIMIREFMKSNTKKDFAIITTDNPRYSEALEQKLQYKSDSRIKFVGTVYNAKLLRKIRENAYGYFHGHEVGGTNPSLLESLASTKLNLLYDVDFNREVAEGAALYWNKEEGNLSRLIDEADSLPEDKIEELGKKAKERISEAYSWEYICNRYAEEFHIN